MPSWKKRWKRLAVDWLALPPDALGDVSRVTCLNGKQVIVENIQSLLHVSEDRVEIDVGHAVLRVAGRDFIVTLASSAEVHLQGEIDSLTYVDKGAVSR